MADFGTSLGIQDIMLTCLPVNVSYGYASLIV